VTAYLIRRLLTLVPVLAVVVTVVFLLIHLIPGDPVSVMLGPDASAAQIEATRQALGLDRPLHEQLFKFYARVLRGDLGQSYFLDRPVVTALLERAEPTMVLTFSALLVAVVIGVPSGIIAAAYQGSLWDRTLMLFSLLGVCVPGFWLSLNFIYLFAVRLGWTARRPLRRSWWTRVAALHYGAAGRRSASTSRGADRAHQPIVHAGGAPAGLHPDRARQGGASAAVGHAGPRVSRNALVPVVTVVGITMAILIGGAVVTEIVFNIPGLGRLIISAVLRRDYPVVQGVILVTATAVRVDQSRGRRALRLHRPADPLWLTDPPSSWRRPPRARPGAGTPRGTGTSSWARRSWPSSSWPRCWPASSRRTTRAGSIRPSASRRRAPRTSWAPTSSGATSIAWSCTARRCRCWSGPRR
jgi:peptide/nickel transport system permease protein